MEMHDRLQTFILCLFYNAEHTRSRNIILVFDQQPLIVKPHLLQ